MSETQLKVQNLSVHFEASRGLFEKKRFIKAVDDISFEISKGETVGLVGESGCGKTTTARSIVRLVRPTGGSIFFKDTDISALSGPDLRKYRQQVQYIFQDPYESLNPRQTIFDAIATPIRIHHLARNREELSQRVDELLHDVNLVAKLTRNKFPHQLSGGQRQRVNIARALATKPELIIADEPVSMLDVSLRAGILSLMESLGRSFGLTFLIITHDIAVARQICNKVAVMYLGRIVEIGEAAGVIDSPIHPYTKLLVKATPRMVLSGKDNQASLDLKSDSLIGSALDLPSGCRFHPRCNYAIEKCKSAEPPLLERRIGQLAACDVVPVEK